MKKSGAALPSELEADLDVLGRTLSTQKRLTGDLHGDLQRTVSTGGTWRKSYKAPVEQASAGLDNVCLVMEDINGKKVCVAM